MSDELRSKAGTAAAKAILHYLPVDGFGQSKRLEEYAAIWGNAAAIAVLDAVHADIRKQVAEEIASAAEEEADELDLPVMPDYLEQRDWFNGRLHALAAKAREIGGA